MTTLVWGRKSDSVDSLEMMRQQCQLGFESSMAVSQYCSYSDIGVHGQGLPFS